MILQRVAYKSVILQHISTNKLEQLERLPSEDTPTTSSLPILLSHIRSQVKRRQSQSYKFKELTKMSNLWIWEQTLHGTHLLKLLIKMCKYKMDPMSIVEDTERTRFCPQTDKRTERRRDKVKPVYPPFNFVEAGNIITTTSILLLNRIFLNDFSLTLVLSFVFVWNFPPPTILFSYFYKFRLIL